MRQRGLLVTILLAACFAWRSAKLLLDRAILNLHQHQHLDDDQHLPFSHRTTNTTTIINGASAKSQQDSSSSSSSSSSSPASLTWFLHFHKAAGSSFTDLALKNNHTFRDADRDKHGHLELSLRQGEFRWELLGAVADKKEEEEFVVVVKNRTTCWVDHDRKEEMEQEQAHVLAQELSSLRQQGVSFVSTEHWFPSHKVLRWTQEQYQNQPTPPTMVVLFRDPVERILSSYSFHNRGGGRCSGTIGTKKKKKRCGLDDWHKGEANMYVSMLNGIPFGPRKVGTSCAPNMLNVGEIEYQRAVESLNQHFQVVLTLDSIRQRPLQVACVLHKALGWHEASTFPQKNRNSKNNSSNNNNNNNGQGRRADDYSNIIDSPQVLHQVQDANAYDIKLYQHAQDMESRLFAQYGCNK